MFTGCTAVNILLFGPLRFEFPRHGPGSFQCQGHAARRGPPDALAVPAAVGRVRPAGGCRAGRGARDRVGQSLDLLGSDQNIIAGDYLGVTALMKGQLSSSDAYAIIEVDGKKVAWTHPVFSTLEPVWNETFYFKNCPHSSWRSRSTAEMPAPL
ncbi:hypothetical protein ON010_g13777 [Phytophthora cinnamomi]|nr:hypothetical protein ON010_g13777 [Phytophthora cinnamomi]